MHLYVAAGERGKGVAMEQVGSWRVAPDEYVEFVSSGSAVKGEYHCSHCQYGVTVHRELPQCPMCGGTEWEATPWSPFTREQQPL